MCSSLDPYTIQGTLVGVQALDGSFSAKVWSLNLSTPYNLQLYRFTKLYHVPVYSFCKHTEHKWLGRKMCFPLIYIHFYCPFSDVSSPQLQPIVKAAELAKETK